MQQLLFSTLVLLCLLAACKKEKPQDTGNTVPEKEDTTDTNIVVSNVPIFPPADTSRGVMTAIKQGKAWKAGGWAVKLSYLGDPLKTKTWTIGFGTVSYNGKFDRENLAISYIPLNCEGKYLKLEDGSNRTSRQNVCGYGRRYDDGDVFYDMYVLDTTATDNYLFISKCDTINKRMEGIFKATFRLTDTANDPTNPPILKFTSGKFWATIWE